MKRVEREWMYERVDDRKMVKYEFVCGVNHFIEYVKTQDEFINSQLIRCPCVKCKNMKYLSEYAVRDHLISKGFTGNYYEWICHGEPFSFEIPNINEPNLQASISGPYRDMIIDALGDSALELMEEPPIGEEETPHPQLKSFFDMLDLAESPLYKGSDMSVLQATARIVNLKCEENLSHKCVDKILSFLEDALPRDNVMTRTYYSTKKLLKALQLPYKKIHCCQDGCMLFWKEDALLEKCKKCGKDRYKPKPSSGKSIPHKVLFYLPIGPRLQRLYATRNIAEAMRWHDENPRKQGTFAHPSDSEAWKHLDKMFPEFASEPRNVRLGLCTDGFTPFAQFGKQYSCWPVMVTPYNLPPWLCMKKPFMFLSLIVPGPKNPKQNLDVYLQPLIEEFKELWEVGIPAFDVSKKQNFQLRATLLWTINDFPAYGMLSGWATAGEGGKDP